ncbi:MAG: alanine--tRNA ligase [Bacteroidales bacterium]|nr:alanine--tRNA ligase [Bacteroidales bacterium]
MLSAKEIRESFKSFFEAKGHKIVPSAPMVIKDDPTLMFTNAGMNQFKDIILGNKEAKYKRVANSQKCLRVSGKHNDLEEVGHDTYHHTMFEMLGNWSFGDYFKEDAINWAWEYLVEVLKLDTDRLYATVFEGSPEEKLEKDNEALSLWKQFLPEEQIIDGNKADNFWEMGDTGPCGPCSEIHIDLRSDEERKKINGAQLVNKDHPHVIEIWNLVFMQYNRKADGSLEPLPNKVIDTGMGFERLCAVLQGKISNYDTDVFQPLIRKISELTKRSYGKDEKVDIAMRVISDHIRTIAFSITDGQLPSNAKAGYVIRRILRRAVRYGYTFLDQKQAFIYKLVPVLIESMGDAYPELKSQEVLIEKVIKEEEDAFLHTLETGIHLLDKTIQEADKENRKVISGKAAFTLYDTFGFPLDLTELILKEKGKTVDLKEFENEMAKQRERARNAATIETGDWVVLQEGTSQFVGYDYMEYEVSILRYREVKRKKERLYQIVLNKTPFYAESGGQVGDTGKLISATETVDIIDTLNENNLTIHLTRQLPKDISATFRAVIDVQKRKTTAVNHTATHLLDQALREVLGTHVEQKGSLVTPEYIRFDFSHFQKMTDEEIRKVEKLINKRIRENIPLTEYRNIPIKEAKEMGAIALFGEKYGEEVRVVQFGSSIEFCGGTHIPNTGHIGIFKIISESSIAAGVRRVEAITGGKVEEMIYAVEDTINDIRSLFNNTPDLTGVIKKYIESHEELQKDIEQYMKEKKAEIKQRLIKNSKNINGIQLMTLTTPLPADQIKDIAFQLRGEITENLFFVAISDYNAKAGLTIMISDNLVEEGLNAGKITREAAKLIQGGGGGQPHYATAGGKKIEGLTQALDKVLELANLA